MSSFAVHATEPTDLDSLLVDQLRAQDCLQMPIKDATQVSTSACGLGAIIYQNDTDEVKARMATGWEALATAANASSSGPKNAIQLSDGSGSFTNNSDIFVEEVTSNLPAPMNRLVLDSSSNTTNNKPLAGLVFKKATGASVAAYPGVEGAVVYGDPQGTGDDFYGWTGAGPWKSLTNTGGGATAAGGTTEIQFNSGGAFAASLNLTFNPAVNPPLLTANADTNLGGDTNITTSGSTTTAQFDTTNGVQIQTTAVASGIDLRSQGNAPMLLRTVSADMELTSTSAGIAFEATTAGQTITSTTGNIVTELKDDGAGGEFLTISSNYAGGSPPDFGIRLRDETTYNQGVGASLYLDGSTGVNTPRSGTMELNTLNGSTSLTRVFLQSQTGSSAGATGGGYRILFASGSATSGSAPTPDNLGSNQTLQNGQFYVGEARTGSRPHVNYNLSGNTPPGLIGFGNFNFAETTMNICNSAETTRYASLGKGFDSGVLYGGNLSVYSNTGSIPEIQLRGDGLATIGYDSSTNLIRLDGTATGASSGGLITIENSSYQSFGNSLANPIKLNATGATPEIVVGTSGLGGPVHGTLRITDGINDSIIADGGANVSNFDGTLTVGTTSSSTTLLGGKNTGAVGLRSIEADGSLLANGIGHISYGTWTGQTYDQRADLCLGGSSGVIPDAGQPTGTENNPNFMIRTQVRGSTTETYPALILNRYLGPASSTVDSRKLQGVMYLNRSTEGGAAGSEKNRVQLATGDPYDGIPHFMMSLVCKQPSVTSSSLLPQGATVPNFAISTPRDPDDGICFNGDIVINRTRGITIDATDYTGPSWSGAQGPLFIGKVNNLAGLKSNTIASTYTVGVEIGANFGGSTPAGNNNTGCIVNGSIRVGNVASMNVVHGGTTHTGYVGDGGLLAINETGLRGSSVYTNIIGVGGTKLYMAKNASTASDGTYVVCSCVEGPQGMVVLRGQVQLSGHDCQIDLDSTIVNSGIMMVPHNNPSFPWPQGTFASMFQNPTVLVTNAGIWDGVSISPSDANLGATPAINQDWTQVRGGIKIDIGASPPQSTLLLQSNTSGTPDLVLNYVVYCERKDPGYTGLAGYPGFTKDYVNPITGTTVTFSGAATPDEIKDNGGGDSGVLP